MYGERTGVACISEDATERTRTIVQPHGLARVLKPGKVARPSAWHGVVVQVIKVDLRLVRRHSCLWVRIRVAALPTAAVQFLKKIRKC